MCVVIQYIEISTLALLQTSDNKQTAKKMSNMNKIDEKENEGLATIGIIPVTLDSTDELDIGRISQMQSERSGFLLFYYFTKNNNKHELTLKNDEVKRTKEKYNGDQKEVLKFMPKPFPKYDLDLFCSLSKVLKIFNGHTECADSIDYAILDDDQFLCKQLKIFNGIQTVYIV
ncbi:hypothetical protein RFI_11189 [Reticulomyxa filosa]|uniref:Uncharacterized protein n=1 Tax=Reticulomyxa filosa TaxID=46433 RepID=X6NJ70_RETFI|nr:hypothetical protein RFI_11189 [Reticulomyxa filosa]|eukprot:ETO25948.1 hypothetical protein RFI_11189 [Reticulomyxa filosa]